MACVGIPSTNVDSEMEEGEIVDEVDELSDISSEEEFLLRQRLEVLENYNNVLERKQAKKTSNASCNGKEQRVDDIVLCDLSEVSETDLNDKNIHVSPYKESYKEKLIKKTEPIKVYKRKKPTKISNNVLKKIKDCKKKSKSNKKKSTSKLRIISSDDSEDEYFSKRRKLANAVSLKKNKTDSSTLKERLNNMLFGTNTRAPSSIIQLRQSETLPSNLKIHSSIKNAQDNNNCMKQTSPVATESNVIKQIDTSSITKMESENVDSDCILIKPDNLIKESSTSDFQETINLCSDNESLQYVDLCTNDEESNSKEAINGHGSVVSSDEDLELLREYALKTKSSKSRTETSCEKNTNINEIKPNMASEDEDSDTAELRLICLKSTLLKKAIEMKQKQKLRKRLSQSSCLTDDFSLREDIINIQSENNTDIESVEMDIGSGEEKANENPNTTKYVPKGNDDISKDKIIIQDDELEEDEDLLRAKLLTSLSKNLPNLVDLSIFNPDLEKMQNKEEVTNLPIRVPEEKQIIIKVGESDSEGEHEATKNLTKMHMKLAEHYQDFQSKLDHLLKSTRKEFENETLPDVVQKPASQKPTVKFIPKAMNHLPKSEQIEYKNLVKRMAELEKIKQARNSIIVPQIKMPVKDMLKPRNVTLNTLLSTNNMEEKIALSRKKIAEESAKILKLKDEAKKLTQKYKIVVTELKNINTAINLNKRQQRAVHSNLQKIRLQHQLLLKGCNHNMNARNLPNKAQFNKIQKENNPAPKENPYTNLLKSVKVSIINDVKKDIAAVQSRLSVQLDVANNKKTIKVPKSPPTGFIVDIVPNTGSDTKKTEREVDTSHPLVEEGGGDDKDSHVMRDAHVTPTVNHSTKISVNDYKSPLEALGNTTWREDPNAFLCPYEVGGSCRDPECKYLHPKIQSSQ